MSYNFCANKLCELNSEDILLMSNASKDDPICVYGGMKNESKPACIEENKAKFIQDDISPGVCEINKKRRDGVCSPWKYFEDVTDNRRADGMEFERPGFYIRYASRSVDQVPYHGGAACVLLDKTLEHLVIPRRRGYFLEAKSACEQIGGLVFYRLNGTYEQMRFLCDNIATYNLWFGMNDTAYPEDCVTVSDFSLFVIRLYPDLDLRPRPCDENAL
ncbi:uncharacterized protein LOC142337278 [Convolutriloba macropyga]|uniref:uncharacterized protein LOC142337278 n=1 Tax=Convolutriloba macropyga TaxID=536237 RepID=UPI003F51CD29